MYMALPTTTAEWRARLGGELPPGALMRSHTKLRRQVALLALRRGIIKQAKALLQVEDNQLLASRHRIGDGSFSKAKKGPFRLEHALQAATTKSEEEAELAADDDLDDFAALAARLEQAKKRIGAARANPAYGRHA